MPIRSEHFRTNCLAWAALHHFLTAELLRELSRAIIDAVSGGQLSLEQLFEESLTEGPDGLQSWILRPIVHESPLGRYLQRRIRYWSDDTDAFLDSNIDATPGAISPKAIEDAVRIGRLDLNVPQQILDQFKFPEGHSIRALLSAIGTTRSLIGPDAALQASPAIANMCDEIDMPLAAVSLKHLGDLSADADDWDLALAFYQTAHNRFNLYKSPAWTTCVYLLRAVTMQSIAAALRVLRGARSAAAFLTEELATLDLNEAPLALLNASHDAWVAQIVASNNFTYPPDRRASILLPPLLLNSLDLTPALESSIEGEYLSAHREFWKVLRLQLALGSATYIKNTKAFYAKSLFDSLEKNVDRNRDVGLFWMAVRLIIESADSDFAEKITWSESAIHTYVDDKLSASVIAYAQKIEASREERIPVVIELFRGWCLSVPADRGQLAAQMLRFVAEVGRTHESSLLGPKNVGGRAIEVLREVGEKRPEFCAGIAPDVASAVLSKLRVGEFWTGTAEALKAASPYLDVLESGAVNQLIAATLDVLDRTDPARDVWVIVQPALDFLVSEGAQRVWKQTPDLAKRIVSTILRFGVNQQTEHTRLLFYLYHFDLGSVHEEPLASQIAEVVRDVRRQARTINASNSVNNIRALLVASAVSNRAGVTDALTATTEILRSTLEGHLSISFANAYEVLLILSARKQQIMLEAGIEPREFNSLLEPILKLLGGVWKAAIQRPLLFAPFAIPPHTKPNQIIVHNWAYASLSFAKSLGEQDAMSSLLDEVAQKGDPELRNGIALARATRLAAGEMAGINPAEIRSENAQTFYSALGQRLASVQGLSETTRKEIVRALLDQCFRLGPRGLDAAVFLLAYGLSLDNVATHSAYSAYAKKLENNRELRELRLALMPLLERLKRSP